MSGWLNPATLEVASGGTLAKRAVEAIPKPKSDSPASWSTECQSWILRSLGLRVQGFGFRI